MTSGSILVIGSGHAAIRAVMAARQNGFSDRLKMVTKDQTVTPYERPPLSKWDADGGVVLTPIIPTDQFATLDIDVIQSQAVALDRSAKTVHLSDGSVHGYDKLLLTTGAKARRLPANLAGQTTLYYLRDAADTDALQKASGAAKSAVIIGGGFIGLELAASLSQRGLKVHVVEQGARLLSRAVTRSVASVIQILHENHGVSFTFGASVENLSSDGLILSGGTVVQADIIVVGIGSVPATGLAQDAGLTVQDGIVVTAQMLTSDDHIYAAGDCATFPLYGDGAFTRLESWQTAGDQGAIAGHNMTSDAPQTYTAVPWFWSQQYDHTLQVSGLLAPDLTMVDRIYDDAHIVSFGQMNNGGLAYACGIAAGLKVAKDIRFSSKLIEAYAQPLSVDLADTGVALKSLLPSKAG